MTETPKKASNQSRKTMLLTVALLVLFAFVFLIVFIIFSTSGGETPSSITEDTYREDVAIALEDADPSQGEALIEEHNCTVCHVLGDGTVAPLFTGIANRAGDARPPLDAEQYLYEAIVHPGAYVLDGYTNSMPNTYDEAMTKQEIGHMIAYLMTLDAENDS